jgi:hypothetical protein
MPEVIVMHGPALVYDVKPPDPARIPVAGYKWRRSACRRMQDVAKRFALRSGHHFKPLDLGNVDRARGVPSVTGRLHAKPGLGTAAEKGGDADSKGRGQRLVPIDDLIEVLPRNAELLGNLGLGNANVAGCPQWRRPDASGSGKNGWRRIRPSGIS